LLCPAEAGEEGGRHLSIKNSPEQKKKKKKKKKKKNLLVMVRGIALVGKIAAIFGALSLLFAAYSGVQCM
jgi:hypothetical protein